MNKNFVLDTAASKAILRILPATVVILAMLLITITPGSAAPPANDNFDNRTVIASLPYNDYHLDTTEATAASDDPSPCGWSPANTVWYEYTPLVTTIVLINTTGSSYTPVVGIYTGSPGMFNEVVCSTSTNNVDLMVTLSAGQAYLIMVGSSPGGYPGPSLGGYLDFHITPVSGPVNNDFDSAMVISQMPYVDMTDTSFATWATDDPTECPHNSGSVWYVFTPLVDMVIEANTAGSYYDTTLAVYTGTRGNLSLVPGACNDDSQYGLQSAVSFTATAGITYYFLVGRCCGIGGNGGGYLVFHVVPQLPPENDSFASATQIDQLPFYYEGNNQFASVQAQEPVPSCLLWGEPNHTVWFKFMPTLNGVLVLPAPQGYSNQFRSVYEGTSLGQLSELGCRFYPYYNYPLNIQVQAGKTYYFQLGTISIWEYGTYQFSLDWAPPPVADFSVSPAYVNPSIYTVVWFNDYSYDPADIGIVTYEWDFGDGATAAGRIVSHRYTQDGDYTARLRVETYDGRIATATKTISVRTHDVAITKFLVPKSARPGQTRQIVIGLRNHNYPEEVFVTLWRSDTSGFYSIESKYQLVPVRNGNRTTDFTFDYTFTDQDAILGKISFRATAFILHSRIDAQPGDNEAISMPTKINPSKKPAPYYSTIIETPGKLGLAATSGLLSVSLLASFLLVVGLPTRHPRRKDR
jgi:hypothetical protein